MISSDRALLEILYTRTGFEIGTCGDLIGRYDSQKVALAIKEDVAEDGCIMVDEQHTSFVRCLGRVGEDKFNDIVITRRVK